MTQPLRALWDLRRAPITFDFANFLVVADCLRQLRGSPSVALTIRYGEYRSESTRDLNMRAEEKRWRVKGILMDLCELLPTIQSLTVAQECSGSFDYPPTNERNFYYIVRVTECFNAGANPLVFRAPAFALEQIPFKAPYVTLTLRVSRHFESRNAEVSDWHKFYNYLRAQGHTVIVIPDQEDILGKRQYKQFDWVTFSPAAMDIRLRMALYENAAMNVCASSGTTACLRYSPAPYIFFDLTRSGIYGENFYRKFAGIEPGQQYPFQRANQRVVWADSTYDNLVSEWDSWATNWISHPAITSVRRADDLT